ncbi:MAG TPA: hypothetical protein ENG40_04270 [Thermoprotei archaeon]|nr:hypothetical protein [Thermoprotei archaeon]
MSGKVKVQNLPKEFRRKELVEKLVEVCRKNDIVLMVIFGSFVRGEQNSESDIDIAIEFDKNSRKTLLDLVRVEEELTKIFGRKVDLGIFSSINPYIIDDVKKEMKVIYEKR